VITGKLTARHQALTIGALLLLVCTGVAIRAAVPAWTPSGDMTVARMGGFPFLLPDGRVVVVGGTTTGGETELFDPSSQTWSAGASAASAHPQLPAAVRLLDGRILITGGRLDSGISVASADMYNPTTDAWTAVNGMNRSRVGHTLTLLADGRVLAAGGYSSTHGFDNTAEIYNPATGVWAFTTSMANGKWLHTATRLDDGSGRVLVAGGEHYYDSQGPHFRITQYYNPATGTWTAGPLLNTGRAGHAAAALPGGRVMVAGGVSGWAINSTLASTEILDGSSWQPGPSMTQARLHFPIVVMSDDTLLVTGGTSNNATSQTVIAGAERYDSSSNTWTSSGVMNSPRRFHTAIQLGDGRVLVAGGQDGANLMTSSELMSGDPEAPQTTATRSIAPNGNGWNNYNVTVTLEATDNAGGSGVQSLVYSLAGAQAGGGTVAGGTASVAIVTEGTTTITYHATDLAGNVEAEHTLLVRIDTTAPFLSAQPNVTVPATAGGTVINFNPTATDMGSGVVSVTSSPLSSGMRFPAGTTTVELTALDAAGNTVMTSLIVTVVPSAPIVTVTGGEFAGDGTAHPATAIARDSAGTTVAGTFSIAYVPGGASAPSAPGSYSASATFLSNDPGILSASPWTTMARAPHRMSGSAVAAINGRLYLYGFDMDSAGNQSSFVPRLSIFDPASNTWSIGASPRLVRAAASVGVINGKMYVAGGCITSDCRIGITNALEIYDPVANTWSDGAPMATGRLGAAAGVIGGRLVVTGGTLACPPCNPTSSTELYNPATNTWVSGAAIPVSHENPASAVVDGLLYVIGGYVRNPGNTLGGGPSGRVDVYDPAANSWTTRSPMPTARYGAAGGVIDGEIHVAGGFGTANLTANESYDPQSDTWLSGPPLLTAQSSTSGAVLGSKLYLFRGVVGTYLGATEVFDPSLTARITISAPSNLAPFANAGGPYVADLGAGVALNASGSSDTDAGDSIVQYSWTIGGALQLSGVNPSLTAAQVNTLGAGPHAVLLTVTDTRGATANASTTLSIYTNVPTASVSVNLNSAACGQFVTFNGSASSAGRPDRSIVSFAWNFGDGTPVIAGGSSIVNHAYDRFGSYTATLTVTDSNAPAKTASTSVAVSVNLGNQAPFANAGGPYSVSSGNSVQLNGALSSDPNAGCGDSIVSYAWTIDGTIHLTGPNPALNTAVNPLSAGSHTVSLQVSDTFGATATASTTVNVQAVLVSISVSPSAVTLSPSQNQMFQAMGHFSDGSMQVLQSGGGGGTSGPNPPRWSIQFVSSSINVSACATAQYPAPISFDTQALNDRNGTIQETWSPGTPVVTVDGTITASNVALTIACTNGPATGTIDAQWTGTRYDGTFSFNGGASTGTVSITGWSAKAPMPAPRFSLVAATVNGIVYAMGGVSPGTWPSSVEAYDPAADSWTTVAQMVTPREGAGAGAVNGRIFVIGGHVAGSIATGIVETYDPATGTWITGRAPMPTPRAYPAVVTDGVFIYAIGGVTTDTNDGGVATVERYDPSANTWSTLAPMPSPGSSIAAGVLNGTIVVVGSGSANSSATDVYDISSNTWRAGSPMPAGRSAAAAGVANGGLYLVGGTVNGTAAYDTWVYYPATGTRVEGWSGVGPMPTARAQAAAAVVNDVIYLIGGMVPGSGPTVEMATNEALSTPPVNTFAAGGAFIGSSGGSSSLPTVQWQSTNPSTAGVDGSGNAYANAPGQTTIVASASNGMSCTTSNTCATLTVADTAPPFLGLPNNMTFQAAGPSGATVSFFASANDSVDGQRPVTCSPSSGSTFPFGETIVTCSASDTSGNTATGTFTITVQDTNPPFMNVPGGNQIRQATSSAGAIVTFTATANDSVDGPRPVTCNPPSGSQFSFGLTTVTCSASDTRGNTATRTFTLTVQDTNAPFLNVPFQPFEVEATSAAGATVNFGQAVSASDNVDGPITPSCTPSSGSTFPIGPTTVSCRATDAHGNQSSAKTFTVRVIDPPVVIVPSNITAEATGAAGAAVLFTVSASTFLDGALPVQCFVVTSFVDGDVQLGASVVPGAMFPLGMTTVGCLATSPSNDTDGRLLTITVADTTSPVVRLVTPLPEDLIPTAPAMVAVDVEVIEAVGVTAVKINGVVASAIGATAQGTLWRTSVSAAPGVALTIAATATDAAGHTGAMSAIIDNDGIESAIDRGRASGADQRSIYSSEFNDGTTAGSITRLTNAKVTAVQRGSAVGVQLATAGTAQVSVCSGNVKYVLLDAQGESADVACSSTGTVTVTAHTTGRIELYKMTPESVAFAQMRCVFLPMGLRHSGICSTSPTPVSYYYSYRVSLKDGQTASTGSPVTASPDNTEPIEVTLLQIDDQGNEFPVGSFELDPGESADVSVTPGTNREDQILFSVLSGTVTVTIGSTTQTVGAGGQMTAATDLTAPTVAIASAAAEPTDSSPIPVSVIFSEPVAGFEASALVVTNATVAGFSGAGAAYTFTLIPLEPGIVTVAVPAAVVTDAAGNGNAGSAVMSRTYVGPPPVVTTSGNVTVEATSPEGAAAAFTATAVDAGGGPATVTCSPESGSVFPIGTTTVTCSSTGQYGNTGSAELAVTVRDTTAPSITAAAPSTTSLWPPTHEMVPITIAVGAIDVVDAEPVCRVTGVSSNEPVSGTGRGDTGPDWMVTGALNLNLRAERAGSGSGRVYTIAVTCADLAGNTSATTVSVTVAHDQK
jgi:N-acetylneuraminic acid mutarotase